MYSTLHDFDDPVDLQCLDFVVEYSTLGSKCTVIADQ